MYLFWTILGLVFLYLDFIKKNTVKLTLAMTFLFCAVVAHKFPDNFLYQVYSLLAFGGLFYVLVFQSLKKEQNDIKKVKKLKDFVGQIATVKKDIGKTLSIDGLGFVEYNNELYSAKSVNDKLIKAGTKVEIVSRENRILNVKVLTDAKK